MNKPVIQSDMHCVAVILYQVLLLHLIQVSQTEMTVQQQCHFSVKDTKLLGQSVPCEKLVQYVLR